MFIRLPARRHGWTALSNGCSGSGMTRLSSKTIFWPRPWHTGHAPAGALKEKCFGVGGSKLLPVAGEHILFECKVSIQPAESGVGDRGSRAGRGFVVSTFASRPSTAV